MADPGSAFLTHAAPWVGIAITGLSVYIVMRRMRSNDFKHVYEKMEANEKACLKRNTALTETLTALRLEVARIGRNKP